MTLVTLAFCCQAIALVVACQIDLERRLIPNEVVLAVVVLRLCLVAAASLGWCEEEQWGGGALLVAVLAAVVVMGSLMVLGWLVGRGTPALGMGDVKLYGACLLWCTPEGAWWFLACSSLVGVVLALVHRAMTGEEAMPFGPAIVMGYYCSVIGCLWLG